MPESKFCSACGKPLRSGMRYCEGCGKPVKGGLPWVGLLLVALVAGAGLALWSFQKAPASRSTPAPISSSVSDQRPVTSEVAPEPEPAEVAVASTPKPEPAAEESDGIVNLDLSDPFTYLPLPGARYVHYLRYPDGDEGRREMVVGRTEMGLVTLEFTHSKLYPDDPPGLWVYHYRARNDGVYRTDDQQPRRQDRWLPASLTRGQRWKNAAGSFEVTEFDREMTVNGQHFTGVLAYRQRQSEVDLDQTVYLAPGYGEILVKDVGGTLVCEFLKVETEAPERVEALLKKHVSLNSKNQP